MISALATAPSLPLTASPQCRFVRIDPNCLDKPSVKGGAGPGMFNGLFESIFIAGLILGAVGVFGALGATAVAHSMHPYLHPAPLAAIGVGGAFAAIALFILLLGARRQ